MTTIFDCYALEDDRLTKLDGLLEQMIHSQNIVCEKMNKVSLDHRVMSGRQGSAEATESLESSFGTIIDVLVELEEQESNVLNQYYKDRGLDEKTFTHFIFDYHFKHQIELETNMDERHAHNFLLFLNTYMNNVTFKNSHFEKNLFKNFLMHETELS